MCQKRPRTGSGPHDGPVLPVLNIKRLCQTCAKNMSKPCLKYLPKISCDISAVACKKHKKA